MCNSEVHIGSPQSATSQSPMTNGVRGSNSGPPGTVQGMVPVDQNGLSIPSRNPTFKSFAMLELSECAPVCTDRSLGRCLVVAGRLDSDGVGTAYYCLPVDMTMFVFEQHFEAPGVVIETRVMVDMFVLTGLKVAYESQELALRSEIYQGQTSCSQE